MNRFSITSYKYPCKLFKTSPIYLIKDEESGKYIGSSFESHEKAAVVCDWINQVQEEYDNQSTLGE